MKHIVIVEMYSSDQGWGLICLHIYLSQGTIGVMVAQIFKEAQSWLALEATKRKKRKWCQENTKPLIKKLKNPNTHHLFDICLKLRLQSREILLHICWMSLLLFCYVEIHIHMIALTPKQ